MTTSNKKVGMAATINAEYHSMISRAYDAVINQELLGDIDKIVTNVDA